MTHQFDSKYEAITVGLFCAGRKNPEIKIVDENIAQFNYVHKDCTMIEFKNKKNDTVKIATTKFRNGFDLWLIDPESGSAVRTQDII